MRPTLGVTCPMHHQGLNGSGVLGQLQVWHLPRHQPSTRVLSCTFPVLFVRVSAHLTLWWLLQLGSMPSCCCCPCPCPVPERACLYSVTGTLPWGQQVRVDYWALPEKNLVVAQPLVSLGPNHSLCGESEPQGASS